MQADTMTPDTKDDILSPYVNTNPDFYTTQISDESEENMLIQRRNIFFSTLDSFIIGPSDMKNAAGNLIYGIDTDKNLTIYALNLMIVGNIRIPGGNVKIYCKNLMVDSIEATIDVSQSIEDDYKIEAVRIQDFRKYAVNEATDSTHGRNGDTIAAYVNEELNKKYGKEGLAAGTIEIVCETLSLQNKLSLIASGSEGYPGGIGEPGASGKNGADETIKYYQSNAANPYPSNDKSSEKTAAKPGTVGGNGGKAGRSGKGGNGNNITCWFKEAGGLSDLLIYNSGGACGLKGIPGAGGKGGLFGRAAIEDYLKTSIVDWKVGGEKSKDGDHGDYISATDSGLDGDYFERSGFDLSEMGIYFNDQFCQMLLQKIKYQYLLNSPTRFIVSGDVMYADKVQWNQMMASLNWLCGILVSSNGKSALRRSIYTEIAKFQIRALQNKTFFGDPCNYVPRIKFSELLKKFQDSYTSWKNFEETYYNVATQLKKADSEMLSREEMQEHLSISISVYKEAYEDMLVKIQGQYKVVIDKAQNQREAINNIREYDDALKVAIQDHFNCKFDDIIRGIEMLTFSGIGIAGIFMGGAEAAAFFNDGVETIKQDGVDVDKKYIINNISQWDKDLKDINLKDHLEYENGEIIEDQQTNVLLGDIADMEAEIEGLKGSLSDEIIDEGRGLIEVLKNAIFDKGEAVLTFNFYIDSCNKYKKSWEDAKKSLEDLLNDHQLTTPYFTQTGSYYAVLYQDMLEKAMKCLYEMNRKLYYLTYRDAIAEIWRAENTENLWMGGKPAKQDINTLTLLFNDIKDIERDYFSHQTSAYQYFPANDQHLISSVHTSIEHVTLLNSFKTRQADGSYKLFFSTVYDKENITHTELSVSNVNTSAGIRISTVQPVLFGARKKLYVLNEQCIAALRIREVPEQIVTKLSVFQSENYKWFNTKKPFHKFKLDETDFTEAIIPNIGKEHWIKYEKIILETACIPSGGNITVTIEHQGNSTILEKSISGGIGTPYAFDHLPVTCELTHDINITENNIGSHSTGSKNIGTVTDEFLGTVGVYADWILSVKAACTEEEDNYGLDLSGVDKITVFFKGWNSLK